MSSHMPTSPRETIITYYMMLHWVLLPRLTTEVVPQGIDTIKGECKKMMDLFGALDAIET